ncbi:isochorismatase family cysteine hydrolase [Amycolatopsis sp. PS_44_ISF1]|uniref:isochorismatase family cysteine hydrolase n=1 Tax=Amycolatopsis sp. PS_44_ISF1 TaxID=2974917 RepID=UPI0028DE1DA3|nr:isochorismatase family cysteine hydrolase [Amycolatopsis sp. PS_44_ISF1]MDT8912996.1 cysteine hydrolase [Amycolatopsis sp. PS_44_ISF1]
MSITTLDARTTLIVVDLQRLVMGIGTRPHTAADVLGRTVALAGAFRARELPVILVRTTGRPPGRCEHPHPRTTPPEGGDTLDPALTEGRHHVVTKQSWDAFAGTGLQALLRELAVTQVVVTGIATTMGVESTARTAHAHGYHVTLVTDAMADRDPAHHHHSLTHVFPHLGETGSTAQLLARLG